MTKASDNQFPKVTWAESAAPATPSTGFAYTYVKTDGKLYLKDDAGTETDLTGGAIPTWIQKIDADASATSIDEFDDASFSGWTTTTVAGGQTISEGRDLVSVQITSAIGTTNVNYSLVANAISTGDAIEVFVHSAFEDDGAQVMFGPIITNGTAAGSTCAAHLCQLVGSGGVSQVWFYPISGVTNSISFGTGLGHLGTLNSGLYMRLEHDATNSFKGWVSADGVTWHNTYTISSTQTPSHIGFAWTNYNSGPTRSSFALDYVRVVTV